MNVSTKMSWQCIQHLMQHFTQVIRIHPPSNMNICTKFRGSLFNVCGDIVFWTDQLTLSSLAPHCECG